MGQHSRDVEPEYIPLTDAALRLGVHVRTLRRRIASGELRAWRLGPRKIMVRRVDIDALLKPIPTDTSAAS
jgi:excisionase family DNA binding protein